ncbi:uncharacterized protein N7459_007179 [Penicillium hispanicum]|uniref:uncharacterized protein n=1 Tax=Penicillium hispanicum TaxID=1080232 RepID=UPI002542291D|nr:uncharacterized protein N7459_007179 [Penicillium hispanicum]KAJ5578215.1 hypothetical protein N7459_007179 [Penicillium hispanicum]
MTAPTLPSEEVVLIPTDFPSTAHLDGVVERYKGIRLHGLLADPQSFTTKYEDEASLPYDTWRSRIQNPAGKTFVSVVEAETPSQDEHAVTASTEPDVSTDALKQLLGKEWVGIVTLLGPGPFSPQIVDGRPVPTQPWDVFIKEKKYQIPLVSETRDLRGTHLVYLVVGVFVSPRVRRKGHGRRLLEAAIQAVRTEAKALAASHATITVQVAPGNDKAQRMYESVGFEVGDSAMPILGRRGEESLVVSLAMDVDLNRP